MDVCLGANRSLRVMRARFSALTQQEVWRAVGTHLGDPDAAAAAAVQLRQEIDLRLGAAFTRFQTMALQDVFDFGEFAKEDGKGPLISYGPCQFPTLGFIVQRAWEAAAHVSEPFWRIALEHTAPDGRRAEFTWRVRGTGASERASERACVALRQRLR
jgi:DNA topoisomerase-3